MTFDKLTRDQIISVKQRMVCEHNDANGVGTSYRELADADELISDVEVRVEYGDVIFSEDDFLCA